MTKKKIPTVRRIRPDAVKLSPARRCLLPLLVLALLSGALTCEAAEIWTSKDGKRWVVLDTTFKSSTLLSRTPLDPLLFPDRRQAAQLFRLRFSLTTQYNEWMNSEVAYEQRGRLATDSSGIGVGAGILPSQAPAPYRVIQLEGTIAESGERYSYRHELDRARLSFHPEWGEVSLGRQAIGLGRGVLFGAVDIFAPFSPLEVDREWRRGVDAVRIEGRFTSTSSAEALYAFGKNWENSAFLGRARGYIGNVDGELLIGKRAEDTMVGGSMSAALLGAEVHGEVAFFSTPESQPEGGVFGNDTLVGKGVLGSSYTFDVMSGLTLLGEYHYSGFGVKDMENLPSRLLDPIFQKRFLRGDTQIVGRHALAVQTSSQFSDSYAGGLLMLLSPSDGSGLLAPSFSWDVAQNFSLIASGFIPWGAKPLDGRIKSEYGAASLSAFLQLNLYF